MAQKEISKNKLVGCVIELENRLKRRPQKRDDSSLYYHSRRIFGSWNKLMQTAGFKIKVYQKIDSVKLDKDFAYFLGLVVTDGHIVHN